MVLLVPQDCSEAARTDRSAAGESTAEAANAITEAAVAAVTGVAGVAGVTATAVDADGTSWPANSHRFATTGAASSFVDQVCQFLAPCCVDTIARTSDWTDC